MKRALAVGLAGLTLAWGQAGNDPILQAMKDELDRSKTLQIAGLEKPYYFQYSLDELDNFVASATLGGLLNSRRTQTSLPRVQVRVGTPDFDNTNYLFSDAFGGSRFDDGQLPQELNYSVVRRGFWLATDRAFKGAVEAISRKRSALKNLTISEALPDFAKAAPLVMISPVQRTAVDEEAWKERARSLSAVFKSYPQVLGSSVDLEVGQSAYRFVNSEGTAVRFPDNMSYVRVRAVGQAADGMQVRDSFVVQALSEAGLPASAELEKLVRESGERVTALAQAPQGEAYSGPVLFEGTAAAQLMGEVMASNLVLPRRPVNEPGRNLPFTPSEWESRVGSRVLPDWLDVTDDPTATEFRGHPLLGTYRADYEGTVPKPLTLIEKGKLKGFLLTRQPVREYRDSNGRARLPGSFGAATASISNLFVTPSETVKAAELKSKFLQLVKDRGKPYGLVVRKMDFPSGASIDELRRLAASGGGGRGVSLPVLVYRVYPDGKEELVRGLRFRGLSARSLRDITAASEELYPFDFGNNGVIFALIGAGNAVAPCTVVSPSFLFDDLELEKIQQELPKLPVVPPPTE